MSRVVSAIIAVTIVLLLAAPAGATVGSQLMSPDALVEIQMTARQAD